jgi:cytochrome c oxidase cbb3-type subunit 3
VVFVTLAGIAPACFGAEVDKAAAERGKGEFISACGFCHGNDATGNRAPDLVRSPLVNHDEKGNLIGPVIRNGRPDKGMPGLPLKDSQISDIAAYLHLRIAEGLSSAGVPRDYPLKKLLTGDAVAGQAYFEGAGGCAKCHSPTGDLKGIASKFSPLVVQHRILSPPGPKPTADVTLPTGEKISGTLVSIDEFDVAIRDGEGWTRSWPMRSVKVEVHDPLQGHMDLMTKYKDADIHNVFAYLETLK